MYKEMERKFQVANRKADALKQITQICTPFLGAKAEHTRGEEDVKESEPVKRPAEPFAWDAEHVHRALPMHAPSAYNSIQAAECCILKIQTL